MATTMTYQITEKRAIVIEIENGKLMGREYVTGEWTISAPVAFEVTPAMYEAITKMAFRFENNIFEASAAR